MTHITTGNIFEDLGLKDSEELAARSDLLSEVNRLIRSSKLAQKDIAKVLGISPPKVSLLTTGKLSVFSTDTLMKYLTLLGCSIEIKLKSNVSLGRNIRKGHMTVRRNSLKLKGKRKSKVATSK